MEAANVLSQVFSAKSTGEIDMSLKARGFFSSLIAGVIFLAVFFFIMPWLLLILAVMGIAVFDSVFLGRGRISITTVHLVNTDDLAHCLSAHSDIRRFKTLTKFSASSNSTRMLYPFLCSISTNWVL